MTSATRLQHANTALQRKERQALNGWTPSEEGGLVIDAEFEALIPPLSDEEYEALEISLLKEGCRDALVVWVDGDKQTLIDGHNRYRLCRRHGLSFEMRERTFDSREDVIVWMVSNQLARRNLSPVIKIELALRSEAAIAQKAKSNESAGGRAKGLLNSTNPVTPVHTRAEIAAMSGTSQDSVRKVKNILQNAPEFVKEKARNDSLSINRADDMTKALKGASEDVLTVVERFDVEDPATITLLTHLHSKGRESFEEIAASGTIQISDEGDAVPITAPSAIVYKAIEKKAKIHKQIAGDSREAARSATPATLSGPLWQLLSGDFRTQMQTLNANSVDAIVTDPPYPQEYLPLYGALAHEAARVLKPGASLLVMCGQSYLPQIMSLMESSLTYHWTLAYLTPGGQSPQIWPRKVNTFWKPILWYVKGDYAGDWHGDVITSERNEKDAHHWQQSISGMADLIHKFTLPDQLILDPFCGSGTTGLACIGQSRRFIGIDCDESALSAARERLSHG